MHIIIGVINIVITVWPSAFPRNGCYLLIHDQDIRQCHFPGGKTRAEDRRYYEEKAYYYYTYIYCYY